MELGAVLVFEAGPLGLRNGGVDVERLRAYTAERLPELPRARQRRVGLGRGGPGWFADDPSFQLDYHVRHASLPRPGDERALKRLAARVFSQALDPDKPLWELWVVEGLEEGRFALIAKLDAALFEDARSLVGTVAAALRPAGLIARAVDGVRDLLGGAAPAHRRIDWLPLDAADLAAVSQRLGAREGDVALAALAGGLRRLRERRGEAPEAAALTALTPICVAGGAAARRVRLPLDEPDPRERLRRLRAPRERAPERRDAPAALPALLRELAALARAADEDTRADLVMIELDAAATPLLGARPCAVVPILPRPAGGALGATATRVGERIFLGLAADAVSMPDLSALTDAVAASFDELRRLTAPSTPRRPRRARRAPRGERALPELR